MKKILQYPSSAANAACKQLRFGLITISLCLIAVLAYPQLKITSSGNIGIDTSDPVSRFSIGDAGSTESKMYLFNSNSSGIQRALYIRQTLSSGSWSYGVSSYVNSGTSGSKATGVCGYSVKSTPSSSGRTFGVYGRAGNATSGYNNAVYGELEGSNNGAAIFGATPGKLETYVNGIYAGYFRGKVYIEDNVGIGLTSPAYKLEVYGDMNAKGYVRSNGVILTSDSRKKTDIQDLGNDNLSKLNSLKVKTFKYKQPDLNAEKLGISMPQDTGKVEAFMPNAIPNAELYRQTQIGLLAQDLQEVYPDLVVEDKEGSLGINYSGLVAVLVAAVKEQQAEIEALKKLINP